MLTQPTIVLGIMIWLHCSIYGYIRTIGCQSPRLIHTQVMHLATNHPRSFCRYRDTITRLLCTDIDKSNPSTIKPSSESKDKPVKPSSTKSKGRFILRPEDVVETVSKGGGPGGQSINKSSNRVRLQHIPTGIIVTCQDFRDLTSNRKHAMTMLQEKVDFAVNGATSKLAKKIDKIRKQKSKRKQRSKAKLSEKNSSQVPVNGVEVQNDRDLKQVNQEQTIDEDDEDIDEYDVEDDDLHDYDQKEN